MPKLNVGDIVRIKSNASKTDCLVTKEMRQHNGKFATVTRECGPMGGKHIREVHIEGTDLKFYYSVESLTLVSKALVIKQDEPVEMTIAEIEQRLGFAIKIVK